MKIEVTIPITNKPIVLRMILVITAIKPDKKVNAITGTIAPIENKMKEVPAAHYIGMAPQTLRKGRCNGSRAGSPIPPYIRIGRSIRYLRSDLDKFLEQHRVDGSGVNQK